MRPWARSFKTLSNLAIFEAKITNVSNHVGQLIALDTIFGATRNALVLFGNFEHLFHLNIDFIFFTFEKASSGTHLIRLETNDFQQELFLDLINYLL
jgi:hypothetical protein